MPVPAAVVPGNAAAVIPAVQHLPEDNFSILCHGKERGCFHFYGQAALGLPGFYLGECFAVKSVGRPGFPGDISYAVLIKDLPDGFDCSPVCLNFSAGVPLVLHLNEMNGAGHVPERSEWFMAPGRGLEPRSAPSKGAVLPLHYPGMATL